MIRHLSWILLEEEEEEEASTFKLSDLSKMTIFGMNFCYFSDGLSHLPPSFTKTITIYYELEIDTGKPNRRP